MSFHAKINRASESTVIDKYRVFLMMSSLLWCAILVGCSDPVEENARADVGIDTAGDGGSGCAPCEDGSSCVIDSDCRSWSCEAGQCVPRGAFISVWDTTLSGASEDDQIQLPLDSSGIYDFTVDWGDGVQDTVTDWEQPEVTHTYDEPGVYTVRIEGQLEGWRFSDGHFSSYRDARKLVGIEQWGVLRLGDTGGAFEGASNLEEITATDTLDLTNTTTLAGTFESCSNLTSVSSINDWDVSHITDMERMFAEATSFNEDIGDWDVSSVTNMERLFAWARAFDQNIGGWDVSSVTTMKLIFFNAIAFDQDIGGWDVSNVTNMDSAFAATEAFNQDIGSWDVSNVVHFMQMFDGSQAFNQDIGDWDLSSARDLDFLFGSTEAFNQDIGSWDVSNVVNMRGAFNNATAFNQDIGDWDVSNVTDMGFMFQNAASFDQKIGGWDISSVTDMESMFSGALSIENYDALLIGWAAQDVEPDVSFHGGDSQYSEGQASNARQTLIDPPNNWSIEDGGQAP